MSGKHVMVIAEAGVNHNGEIKRALELIDVAAEAGADYVGLDEFVTKMNSNYSTIILECMLVSAHF